jgi:hypothetical protein
MHVVFEKVIWRCFLNTTKGITNLYTVTSTETAFTGKATEWYFEGLMVLLFAFANEGIVFRDS